MKAIKILLDEHVLIIKCLNLLDKATEKIIKDDGPPKEFLEKGLSFCSEFSDIYHHYKEEHVMFNYMAQKKEGAIDAQIESHRNQHENLRNIIKEISGAVEGYSEQLNEPTRLIHRNLCVYVKTLRSHIKSENEIFFPMVLNSMNENDDKFLLGEFEKYEKKVTSDVLEKNKKILSEMSGMI